VKLNWCPSPSLQRAKGERYFNSLSLEDRVLKAG
jgi:hypothetical protein